MADILMFTDIPKLNEWIQRNSVQLPKLTQILLAYQAMYIGVITGAEFRSLVQNPAAFVFDKMTNGQDVVIGGLKVNKTKALEILEKPEGYEEMKELITTYQNTVPNWNHYLSLVDVDENDIVLAQSVIDAQTEAFKVYAKTDKEKKILEFAQELIALVNTKFGPKKPILESLVQEIILTQQVPFGSNNNVYVIQHNGIKGINRLDV